MVDIAMWGEFLIRMAIQAVGRVGALCDGVNDLLPRAVMTGGAGADPVGGHIVLNANDFRPVRYDMTGAAKNARSIKGEIIGADFHRMRKRTMIGLFIRMAVDTDDLAPIQALLNGLSNDSGVNECAGIVVTDGAEGHRDDMM